MFDSQDGYNRIQLLIVFVRKIVSTVLDQKKCILRTERGLSIAGTGITLFDVMQYLKAGYPHGFIQDSLTLTSEQLEVALGYISTHSSEVETEYQEMLRSEIEIRSYWENHNRDRFAQIDLIERSGYEAVREKLKERRSVRLR